jgi:hypothetical protein
MKRLLIFLLGTIICASLSAEIGVKSFRKLINDTDARVNAPKRDQNGDLCAIIKVVTTEVNFSFDCGQIGIVNITYKPSEIWVYIPFGTKRMTITHPQLGILRDYLFTEPIEKATVYEMVLATGKVVTTVEETIVSQWLAITTNPDDAAIYINDQYVNTGMYQAKHKPGIYSYRIEASLYHTEAGKVEILDTKKELNIILKPAFGYLKLSSSPEQGARVFIDGKQQTGTSPFSSDRLASGEHTVQVLKEMYQPQTQKIIIQDGKTTEASLVMKPNYAEVNVAAPAESEVYINNELKGNGPWQGRLNAGIYSVEVRREKHRPAKQDIEVKAGEKRTVNLQPLPIYGSLDVITTPIGASIVIDGKDYGTTPKTISKLLVGDYNVTLSKDGYATIYKKITIVEAKSAELNERMVRGKSITVTSNPSGASLTIDGKKTGSTPQDITLEFGTHNIRLDLGSNVIEEKLVVDQNSQSIINYLLNRELEVTIHSIPGGANVSIDGIEKGITPLKVNLEPGLHYVRVASGNLKKEETINISQSSLKKFDFVLNEEGSEIKENDNERDKRSANRTFMSNLNLSKGNLIKEYYKNCGTTYSSLVDASLAFTTKAGTGVTIGGLDFRIRRVFVKWANLEFFLHPEMPDSLVMFYKPELGYLVPLSPKWGMIMFTGAQIELAANEGYELSPFFLTMGVAFRRNLFDQGSGGPLDLICEYSKFNGFRFGVRFALGQGGFFGQ